jgi:hypothetical protein
MGIYAYEASEERKKVPKDTHTNVISSLYMGDDEFLHFEAMRSLMTFLISTRRGQRLGHASSALEMCIVH